MTLLMGEDCLNTADSLMEMRSAEEMKSELLNNFSEKIGSRNSSYRFALWFVKWIFESKSESFLESFNYDIDNISSFLIENISTFNLKAFLEKKYWKVSSVFLSRSEEFGAELASLVGIDGFNFLPQDYHYDIVSDIFNNKYRVENVFEKHKESYKFPNVFRRPLSELMKNEKFEEENEFVQSGEFEWANDLMAAAKENKFRFDTLMEYIAIQASGREVTGLKWRERIDYKVENELDWDYNKVKDALRGYLIFHNVHDLNYALNLLFLDSRVENVFFKERMDVDHVTDSIKSNRKKCQNDVKVVVKLDTGYICEIQLHIEETYSVKEEWIYYDQSIWSMLWTHSDREIFDNLKKENPSIQDMDLPEPGSIVSGHDLYVVARLVSSDFTAEALEQVTNEEKLFFVKLKRLESRLNDFARDSNKRKTIAWHSINSIPVAYIEDKRKEATNQ